MDQQTKNSLIDLVLGHANLLDDGIEAFRQKDYAKAIEKLNLVIDKDKNNWDARMFLAMSLYASGQMHVAAIHFRFLADNCPKKEVADKARAALAAINGK